MGSLGGSPKALSSLSFSHRAAVLPFHSFLGRSSTTTTSPWIERFRAFIPWTRMSLTKPVFGQAHRDLIKLWGLPHATHWPCGEKLPPSKGRPNFVPQVRNEETQPTRPLTPRAFRRASSAHLYGKWPFPAQAYGSPRWNFVRPTGAMQPGSGEQPNEPQAPPDSWAAASGRSSLSPPIQPHPLDFQGVCTLPLKTRTYALLWYSSFTHFHFHHF